MPIQVTAYISGGVVSGVVDRPGHLREIIEQERCLALANVRCQALDALGTQDVAEVTIPIDDVLIAVGDDDPSVPVHAAWHAIRVELGPYVVEGDMPTLPGFDPGRALTRPSGEFVLLKDVRLGRRDRPEAASVPLVSIGQQALINRYGVERVEADLMLGFFFPGAEMVDFVDDNAEVPMFPPVATVSA